MNSDHKFTLAVGALALVAVLLVGFAVTQTAPRISSPPTTPEATVTDTAPATGKVDDAVSAFLADVEAEQNLLLEEESDLDLVTSDANAAGEFGQAYDENEL
ncbi:MAG: hypothetical protein HY397_01480 [Candidatus Doudnabacteria bacterium]|nr:hypothetical protein [Candidatus Doudnabacteria bacterium]